MNGCTEIHFIEPDAKVNDVLSRQSSFQEATARRIPKIPGLGFVFQQDGALAHRARDTVAFLERKVPDFVSPTLWSPNAPDLNPEDYSICRECRPYAGESFPLQNS